MGLWVAAVCVAAGGVVLSLGVAAYMAHAITRPSPLRATSEPTCAAQAAAVTFMTADGVTLHGCYLPHPKARDAIIVAHGFRMTRGKLLDLARGLHARGHHVLVFDLRAHGASGGARSTIGYNERLDVIAAARFLRAHPALDSCPIGALGISMGAVASILAAAEESSIAAVAADSAYTTLQDIAAGGLRLLYRLPAFPFAPLVIRFSEILVGERIAAIRPVDVVARLAPRPLLLIHGVADRLIPVANARALYAAAGEPKELWLIPDLDHARAFRELEDEYLRRLDEFFTAALRKATVVAA